MNLRGCDSIESPITLVYRRKGEKHEHSFLGPVGVLDEDRKSITWLRRQDLPLREGRLDLTRVPVVGIGGKRKSQPGRAQSFLEENPSFQGALLLYPGTGNWDLGEGMLILTSREILYPGRRVSGGRPEVQLTNHRWLRDGRYVANRAKMLHSKILEILATEVEQEPGAEAIAEALVGWSCPFDHRLRNVIAGVCRELRELEDRRVIISGEKPRDMASLVRERLAAKLREAGVRYVRDIPEDLTVTGEEIAPELVSQRDTLGTVELPGLGRRLLKKQYARFGFSDQVLAVELSVGEFRQLESWPLVKAYPVLNELGNAYEQLDYSLRDAVGAPEAERIGKLREFFSRRWLEIQKAKNWPQDIKVTDPREADPPATPEPVSWGFDLMTGKAVLAYAALVHERRGTKAGGFIDCGWKIRWFDDPKDAEKADDAARREAESYITARRLEAELAAEAEAEAGALPGEPPAFTPFAPTIAQLMEHLGFKTEQFRIEGEGPISVCVSPQEGYYSEARDRYIVLKEARYANQWWFKEGDMIVVFANATVHHLIGHEHHWGAAGELGVAQEKIQATREWFEAEKKKAEDNYRTQLREFVQSLQTHAAYSCLSKNIQERIARLAEFSDLSLVAEELNKLRPEWAKAEALRRRVEAGECLANFGGRFRIMGATNQVQYWVIRPDGSERLPDEVKYRTGYTLEGEKLWRLVGREELAISWFKAYTAADHEFVVNKLPVGGCTPQQLSAVERIAREIAERWPQNRVGKGWGLRK